MGHALKTPLATLEIDIGAASDLLLSPDVEPAARAFRNALAIHSDSYADMVGAVTLFAAAVGVIAVEGGNHALALSVQHYLLDRVYADHTGTVAPPDCTLH